MTTPPESRRGPPPTSAARVASLVAALAGCHATSAAAAHPAAPQPRLTAVAAAATEPAPPPNAVRILARDREELGHPYAPPLDWIRERTRFGVVFGPTPVVEARELWGLSGRQATHCYAAHYPSGSPYVERVRLTLVALGLPFHAGGIPELVASDDHASVLVGTDVSGVTLCVPTDQGAIASAERALSLPAPLREVAALAHTPPHLVHYERERDQDEASAAYLIDAADAAIVRAWLPAHGFEARGEEVWVAGTDALLTVALAWQGPQSVGPPTLVVSVTRGSAGHARPSTPLHGPAAERGRCDIPREDESLPHFEDRCLRLL